MRFEEDGARDLFNVKLVSQRDDDEGDAREPREQGRGKTQPHPEADVRKARWDLRAMKELAEAQPPAFREGAMKMYRTKATAYKAPTTITPKKKRRVDRGDPTDNEDHEEGEHSNNDSSDPDQDDPPPRRKKVKKPRAHK